VAPLIVNWVQVEDIVKNPDRIRFDPLGSSSASSSTKTLKKKEMNESPLTSDDKWKLLREQIENALNSDFHRKMEPDGMIDSFDRIVSIVISL